MKIFTKCVLCFTILTTLSFSTDAHWSNWRGPSQDGSVDSGDYPVKWDLDSEQVLWKVDIEGKGFSTPVVWGETIFLTTGVDDLDTVLAL